ELESLCTAFPLRERFWRARMLALYRSGQRAESLRVFDQVRRRFGEELGLEPSQELHDLETAIIRQDPGLDWKHSEAGEPGPAASKYTVRVGRIAGAVLVLPGGDRIPVSDHRVLVGRDAEADVVLTGPSISRLHAEIRPHPDGHLLIDLRSLNGTFVNGKQVAEHLLADGDEIAIGPHVLRYRTA